MRTDPGVPPHNEQTLLQQSFDLSQNRSSSRPIPLPKALPAGSSVSFQFKPNWLLQLRKTLYRPGFVIRARIDFADGHHENYRLVPSAAIELPLQPLPATNGALLGYVQAKQGQKQPTATPATTPVAIRLQLQRRSKGSTLP